MNLLVGVRLPGYLLIVKLFQLDLLVDLEIFKLGLFSLQLPIKIFVALLKFLCLLLCFFDLLQDGILALIFF